MEPPLRFSTSSVRFPRATPCGSENYMQLRNSISPLDTKAQHVCLVAIISFLFILHTLIVLALCTQILVKAMERYRSKPRPTVSASHFGTSVMDAISRWIGTRRSPSAYAELSADWKEKLPLRCVLLVMTASMAAARPEYVDGQIVNQFAFAALDSSGAITAWGHSYWGW